MEKEIDEIHMLLDRAKDKLAEIGANRTTALVATKLDEARLWLHALAGKIDL
jgi:hypothetical protein